VDHILQLGLNKLRKTDHHNPTVQIDWFIDQLLEIIANNLVDEDTRNSSYRSQFEGFRQEFLKINGINIPSVVAKNALDLCRNQFRNFQIKQLKKDEYFAEIIVFLRQSLASLTGDSKSFHEDLLGTTGRINDLIELKDIKELKERIAAEVTELNRVVSEKQKHEQVQFNQLSDQISVLQCKLEVAKAEASLDGLTGVANRRNFDYTIQRWIIAHDKSEKPFTVAIIDLDNFKHINDNYGHQIGDQVLAATAMELGKNIRSSDFLARYGGEEFVILSAGIKLSESEKRFSGLLSRIEEAYFGCKTSEMGEVAVSLTASCGVAEYALGESTRDLINRADEALYEAKRLGKNRVVIKRRPLLSAFYEGRKSNSII
jgi:diguanylate cyclase (GGDEF)-like protein